MNITTSNINSKHNTTDNTTNIINATTNNNNDDSNINNTNNYDHDNNDATNNNRTSLSSRSCLSLRFPDAGTGRRENMVGVNMLLAEFVRFKHGLYKPCGIEWFEGIMLESRLLQPCVHVAGERRDGLADAQILSLLLLLLL